MTGNTPTAYDFRSLARFYLSLIEGDDHLVDDAYELMRKFGICDEDGFYIYADSEYN